MPDKSCLHIDLLKLNDNPAHQKLLIQFLREQKDGRKKIGKKINSRGDKVIHKTGNQLFSLSHSIFIMPNTDGRFEYRVLASNENNSQNVTAGKRKVTGKGAYGSAIEAYPLEEKNGVLNIVLEEDKRRIIKKIVTSSDEGQTEKVEKEYEIMRLVPHLDAKAKSSIRGRTFETTAHYIDMIKLKGETLENILSNKKLTDTDRFKISINLISALKKLEEIGIVHSDIKPQNIIVNLETHEVNFIDFGAAGLRGEPYRTSTPGYEGLPAKKNGLEYAHDIYSLHVVLAKIWGGIDKAPLRSDAYYLFLYENPNPVQRFMDFQQMTSLDEEISSALKQEIHSGLAAEPEERIQIEKSLEIYTANYQSFLEKKEASEKRKIAILKGSMVELLAAVPRSVTETIVKVESSIQITRPFNEQADVSSAHKTQSNFPLHRAVEAGDVEAVKKLLARGAKIDREDQHQLTPLHVAVKVGQIEIAKLLLTKGATAKLRDGRNLVHTAAQGGQVEMLKELVAQKWKLNARDLQDNNALYYAVMQLKEKQNDPDVSTLETIVFLLEHNVKPDQKTIEIFNKILAPEAVKSIEAAQIKRILQYIFEEIKALNDNYFAVSGQPYRKQMIENLNKQMVRIEAAVNKQEIKNFPETLVEVSFLLSETKRKVEQDQQAVDTVLGFGVIGKSKLIKGIEAIESSCKLRSLTENESQAMREKLQIDFTLSGIEAALVRDKVYLEKHPVFLHAIPYASIAIEQFLKAINKIKSADSLESRPANMPQQAEALNTIHRLISMLVNYEKKQVSKWITAYEDKKVDYLNDINQKIFEACEALKKADYQGIKTCETEINKLARKANSSTKGCFTFFQPELVMPPLESSMTLTGK